MADWWNLGVPLTDYSSITSSDLADDSVTAGKILDGAVTAGKVAAAVSKYIPGVATIALSSHSSDNEYQATIALFDVAGNAWARRQHVRVYVQASTLDAGSSLCSTAPAGFGVKSSATTDAFSWVSTANSGVPASTNTAGSDKEFITTSDGVLTVSLTCSGAAASTWVLVLDWLGGVVKSSDTFGTTVAAT